MIELRLIVARSRRWGTGKVHAAAWTLHPLWGPDWFPVCTGDHIDATPPVAFPLASLSSQLTCKRCIARIAANPSWTRRRAAV